MPVITRAIYVPIPGVPEKPTALRHHAPATELTEQQKKICAELGVSPEAFLHTKATGEFGRFRR
ncbi:MAG: hypothetical protein L6Q84_24425 [Polyangiaceae bacterium]|nr:hypothetical protein [Polyangiaceae bacterium]